MSVPVLVIGVGNPTRGDDGAGREVARRLRQSNLPHVRVLETEGEATALLSLMEGAAVVFLIDACVSGAPAGSIRRIDLSNSDLPEAGFGLSSHGFGLAEAIALGKALGSLPPQCVIYALEAESFELGTPLSESMSEAIDAAVVALCQEIASMR